MSSRRDVRTLLLEGSETVLGDYEPLDLAEHCNAGLKFLEGQRLPPVGEQHFHGLPFRIGKPDDPDAPCFILLEPDVPSVCVPVGRSADRIIVAHRTLPDDEQNAPRVGTVVAEYTVTVAGRDPITVPIRERFEICRVAEEGWDLDPAFLARSAALVEVVDRHSGPWEEIGLRQMEGVYRARSLPDYYLWVWENPYPRTPVEKVELAAGKASILVAAITTGHAGEHPFPSEAARIIGVTMTSPLGERSLDDPRVEVDRGEASYAHRMSAEDPTVFLDGPVKGWGEREDATSGRVYARVAAVPSATVRVKDGESEVGSFRWGELTFDRPLERDGMRVEVLEQARNWVAVTVLDEETERPVPCRIAFRTPEGVPYQPHGHHNHVNPDGGSWHIDIGGDVRLGRLTYAYIDGTCEGWLPRGDVFVDVSRGFEYEPLRQRIRIASGQREVNLRIRRWTNLEARGWYSGDSHVHFLSAQGALTEQQGEDLNVVNLLQSQWGSLFTGTEEFTGGPLASEDGRYVTWVSQENRQHLLGHLVMWGLKRAVMPWCTDGLAESELGGWLETTMSDWADRCHEDGGTAIIPHFPRPYGEPEVLIATGRADGIEFIVQRRFSHEEYYRYLNTGYRLPLVGGTDKMSADVPVGLYRTYARLGDEEFTFDGWRRAVQQGRTFLSGGPIIELYVEGQEVGDTVCLSSPGTIEIFARAESIFPIWTLQLVQNGRVVASTEDPRGVRKLELHTKLRVDGHCWLAARCGGPQYFDAPGHLDPWERGIMAHTSPVYIACGDNEWLMFDPGHVYTMLALIEGGLEYVRRSARRYPEDRITHHHHEADHAAFLERPFLEARDRLRARLDEGR